ncbi:MAG: cell division protein FtsA [Lachnospiraceae bacterium]|nr:cell division protein FtsA [Lachnospiraceae bacterium]
MEEDKKNPGQLVFGLDIGTRSLVGTVGYKTGDKFHVVAQCVREHESRSMLDGQIHDINTVGRSIADVKQKLENQIGKTLNEVCIAAAGRVLKTVNANAEIEFAEDKTIDTEDIHSLEMLGVEKAFEELTESNKSETRFYCVGYTVVHYYMNGLQISVLDKHKAKRISVELIATFLPDDVVDGLYRAVEVADLQVANLTLEPIAAIQVAIPESFRMLNLALVDVGAGTSDISITKDGSIVAYGMIPMAGDELTEAIVKQCLVDFSTGEEIKTSYGKKVIKYNDIMGIQQKITSEEIDKIVEPVVRTMTKEISDKIKELNGDEPVSAIFVVGGGGKLPIFAQMLADEQGISRQRCALRGEEVLKEIDYQIENPNMDSMFVTPIGICLNFYDSKNNFIYVNFNGDRVKLYDNGHLMVVDAAIQAGFPNEGLFPKRGQALSFTLNGTPHMIRGELGETAVVKINDEEVSINTAIRAGDKITVTESTAGAPASAMINKLKEYDSTLTVIVNDTPVALPKYAEVNGELESGYYEIRENDNIKLLDYYTVEQIASFMDVTLKEGMNIYVNNKLADKNTLVYSNFSIIWTLEELSLSDVDKEEDYLSYEELPDDDEEDGYDDVHSGEDSRIAEEERQTSEEGTETAAGPAEKDRAEGDERNKDNEAPDSGTGDIMEDTLNALKKVSADLGIDEPAGSADTGQPVNNATGQPQTDNVSSDVSADNGGSNETDMSIVVRVNGEDVRLTGKKEYIYVDVFEFIDFDLSKPQGHAVVTRLNDRAAIFNEPIKSGDVIEIYWEA